MQSQNDAAAARTKFVAQRAGSNPDALGSAYQEFQNGYEPKVFEFNRMPDDQATAYAQALQANPRLFPGGYPAFKARYDAAHAAGWVQ